MITVLLDSSNISLSVGIAKDNELLDFVSYDAWQQQSEYMLPELDKLLNKHGITKDMISDVIVAVGPGSYTGVRISLTIAKVMGTALNIPVYPISSLRCLKDCKKPSICLINARSNRSYFAVYADNETIVEDCIMQNDKVLEYINEHPEYSVCGVTDYLKVEGVRSNLLEQMISLKSSLTPSENVLGLKPIYLKD